MAIIDLGTKAVSVGQTRQFYDPFEVDIKKAYLIFAEIQLTNQNNVFSYIRFNFLFTSDEGQGFFLPQTYDLEIFPSTQSFYLPMSELYVDDGLVTPAIIRLSNVRGGSDSDSGLTLCLFYDDDADVKTWL